MKRISIFAVALMLVGVFAVAQEQQKTGFNLETRKTEIIKGIDERIAALQKHKECVQAAQDRNGLKECHKRMNQERKAFHSRMKERRIERMKHRLQRLEEDEADEVDE